MNPIGPGTNTSRRPTHTVHDEQTQSADSSNLKSGNGVPLPPHLHRTKKHCQLPIPPSMQEPMAEAGPLHTLQRKANICFPRMSQSELSKFSNALMNRPCVAESLQQRFNNLATASGNYPGKRTLSELPEALSKQFLDERGPFNHSSGATALQNCLLCSLGFLFGKDSQTVASQIGMASQLPQDFQKAYGKSILDGEEQLVAVGEHLGLSHHEHDSICEFLKHAKENDASGSRYLIRLDGAVDYSTEDPTHISHFIPAVKHENDIYFFDPQSNLKSDRFTFDLPFEKNTLPLFVQMIDEEVLTPVRLLELQENNAKGAYTADLSPTVWKL